MSAKQTDRERRRHTRIQLDRRKHCANISEGGLFIITDRPRRLGSLVHFELRLDDLTPPIRGRGKVVRVIHATHAAGADPTGMAIEFVEMDEADRDRIRDLTREEAEGGGRGVV